MKKSIFILGCTIVLFSACNNEASNPVEKADSLNEVKQDQMPVESASIENTSKFLVKAADHGMAEVELAKLGAERATQQSVKDFAAMMVKDHTAANGEVSALAAKLNITLPATYSEEHKKTAADLRDKKAKDFDKDFMDAIISNHKKTIDEFKDASDDEMNAEVKTFITATLPTLQSHLDAAEKIRKAMK